MACFGGSCSFTPGSTEIPCPFTTCQLEALVIPETFPVIDWESIFDVRATPLREALNETFLDRRFADVVLDF